MTNVGETSVPTTTGPLAAHREHSILVLEHLVTHGPATRSELATATGLGRGAIAGLTARLIDAGVLRPAEHDPSGDGRATPLSLSAADHVLVTTLLRPDEAVATVAGLSGEELARFTVPLDEEPDDEARPAASRALDALAVALDRALARAERSEHPIADVTVLVAGAVAGAPPVVITDDRLGAEPVDVLGELRARVPALAAIEPRLLLPITLEPAAVAAAAAEHAELPGVHDVLYLNGDTGVAAAAISGGRPLVGAHGLAVTFAHLPVVQDGVRCECGQRGCLATVAAPGLVLERAGLESFATTNGYDAALEELVARITAADDRARWSWLDAALLDRPRPAARGPDRRPGRGRRRRLLVAADRRHRHRVSLESADDRGRRARGDPHHHGRAGRRRCGARRRATPGARAPRRRAAAARRLSERRE